MKNPFEKKDNTVLIASVVIGSIAAGVATWLFTTEQGSAVREQLAAQFDKLSGMLRGDGKEETEEEDDHSAPYTHKKPKAPKTDREALLKNEILHEPNASAATE